MADHGKRDAWYKDSQDNMRQALQLRGYDIRPEAGKRGARDAVQDRAKSAAGKAGGLPKFSSPNDPGFAALPSGAYFLDGSGNRRQKK